MSVAKKVKRLQKKLEELVRSDTRQSKARKYLKSLRTLPVTLEVLKQTRIGMTVNVVRKWCKSVRTQELGRDLIKDWKTLLVVPSADSDTDDMPFSSGAESSDEYEASCEEGELEEPPLESIEQLPASSVVTQEDLSNAVRIKCREMFYGVLIGNDHVIGRRHAEKLATDLESEIFRIFRKTDFRYKNRFNSRFSNLKDKKNPALRMNFLYGSISPAKLAVMSPHELASEEMKKLRASFVSESINRAQLACFEGNQTDLLKCGKCQKRNCTYNQLQTRSGDEPMTTFVACNECGNRWKF